MEQNEDKCDQKPFQQKFLHKIELAGYGEQNKILMENGHTRLFQNLKILISCDGNTQQALTILNEIKNDRQDRFNKIAKTTPFQKELLYFQDKGWNVPPKQLLNILEKCNGSIEQTEQVLMQQKEQNKQGWGKVFQFNNPHPHDHLHRHGHGHVHKFRHRRQSRSSSRSRSNSKELMDQYQAQIIELESRGYTDFQPKKLKQLLKKFSGSLMMVMEHLEKKRMKFQKNFKKNDIKLQYHHDQVELLVQNGIIKGKLIQKAIEQSNNDDAKLFQFIDLQKEKKQIQEQNTKKIINIIQQTNEYDFQKVQKILQKVDGDEQKAINRIIKKQEIYQTLITKYPDQVKQLLINGIKKPKNMFNALQETNGNTQQAIQFLTKPDLSGLENLSLVNDFKPQEYQQIYIDGNNLFFINDKIRKIHQKNKNLSEKIITDLIRNWTIHKDIEQKFLIFDYAQSQKIYDRVNQFTVLSAKPDYKTADDLIVVMAQKLDKQNLNEILFVTSDRGLTIRLIDLGVQNVMKSKVCMESIVNSVGEEVFDIIVSESQN